MVSRTSPQDYISQEIIKRYSGRLKDKEDSKQINISNNQYQQTDSQNVNMLVLGMFAGCILGGIIIMYVMKE